MREDKDLIASHGCIFGIIAAVVMLLFVVIGKILQVLLPLVWSGLVALTKGIAGLIGSLVHRRPKASQAVINSRKP